MNRVTQEACAKINLGLDVTGRREDGYHLVRMIMQTVDIRDILEVEREAGSEEAPFSVTLVTDSSEIPAGGDNLICRAMNRMAEACGLKGHCHVRLTKRIPVAAGMAGGSTDAAGACLALRRLYDLDMTDEDLQKLLLPLGADIPYCVTGGTQLSEGIGEILTPLPDAPACALAVVKPPVSVSTPDAYRGIDAMEGYPHPDIDGQIRALEEGDLPALARRCANVLELVTGEKYPVIRALEELFMEYGALTACMSGSGPTVYAIFRQEDRERARQALEAMAADTVFTGCKGFLTGFCQGPAAAGEDRQ